MVRPAQSSGAALLVDRPSGIGMTLEVQSQRLRSTTGGPMLKSPVLMCTDMRRISTLRHDSGLRPYRAISIKLMAAIRLIIRLALPALKA